MWRIHTQQPDHPQRRNYRLVMCWKQSVSFVGLTENWKFAELTESSAHTVGELRNYEASSSMGWWRRREEIHFFLNFGLDSEWII
jgi:hypothetical protein